jgi:hypothetical protein
MIATARAWVRRNPGLAVAGYAGVFAAIAFALTRPVLLVNDGQMYFEMARSMRHGTLEFYNGLDLVDSPELWMQNAVKRGPHLFAKYPPLFGVLAAAPYALFGIRGLYLLNAVGFWFAVLAFHEIARRALGPSRALVATALLPFAVPLVPYMLMELPHLVALALFLWAVVLWDDARRSDHLGHAARSAVLAGLLAGFAFGVRIQDVVLAFPLVAIGFFHSRHRRAVLGGMLAGFGACVLAIAAFNLQRFGSANPFSYGPHESALGAPVPEEGVSFFLRPAFVAWTVTVTGALLVARRCARAGAAWLCVLAASAVVVAVPSLRDVAHRSIAALASMTLNASVAGAGWSSPDTTLGWIDKALLSSTPFAVLGLVGVVAVTARRAPPLQTALGWMAVSLLLFLSARDPDPRTLRSTIGFLSLSPRYLVEIMPGLYLLAWDRLRNVRFAPVHLALGIAVAGALFEIMRSTGPDELVPAKTALILTGSIVAAALLASAYLARRSPAGAVALGALVALTNGYAAACIFAEDSRCLRGMAATYEQWGERILGVMPEPRVALVGWRFAKDAVFHVRARKPVIVVDPSVDEGAALASTLDALVAHGVTPYYFGLGLERAAPLVGDRYSAVPVLGDPLLWRLEGTEGPATR